MTNWKKVEWSYDENPEVFPLNKKINKLNDKIRELKKKYKEDLKTLELEVDRIQNECDHYYHMRSSGAYEDNYECKFCGHETEK